MTLGTSGGILRLKRKIHKGGFQNGKQKETVGYKKYGVDGAFCRRYMRTGPVVSANRAVPISLTDLVIYFSIFILGWQKATITYLVYLLIGMAGLPVFSGFESGVGKFVGPTGGYLVGFILMTIVSGLFIQIRLEKTWLRNVLRFTGMVVGTAIAYAFATGWFCFSTGTESGRRC